MPDFEALSKAPRCPAGCTDRGRFQVATRPLQVNLFLRIVRRREDGFHDLASLFHVIDLGDSMTFAVRGGSEGEDTLACDMEGVPTDASNLVIKACGHRETRLPSLRRLYAFSFFCHFKGFRMVTGQLGSLSSTSVHMNAGLPSCFYQSSIQGCGAQLG